MTTAWSHLPNAKYIDLVLESIEKYPEKWDAAWHTAWGIIQSAAYNAAYNTADNVACSEAYNAAYDAACFVARVVSRRVARRMGAIAIEDAIMTLIAYEDCAYMIESDIGELKILAAFGDPRAILLLPACIVFNEINKNKVNILQEEW